MRVPHQSPAPRRAQLGRVSTKVVKIIVKNFKVLIFAILCFFFVNLGLYEAIVKVSNDISPESTNQILSPKLVHIPREGLYYHC